VDRLATPHVRREILLESLIASVMAGAAVALGFRIWMMFIGWIAFRTGGEDLRKGAVAIACMVVGATLAGAGAVASSGLQPTLGELTQPLIVFSLTAVALLLSFTPLNSLAGCFLGMTGFFASNLISGERTFIALVGAGGIGAAGAYLAVTGRRWLHTRA
jgi:hypothetical protein